MMSVYLVQAPWPTFEHTDTVLATGGGEDVTVWSFHGDGDEDWVHENRSESLCTTTTRCGRQRPSNSGSGVRLQNARVRVGDCELNRGFRL